MRLHVPTVHYTNPMAGVFATIALATYDTEPNKDDIRPIKDDIDLEDDTEYYSD